MKNEGGTGDSFTKPWLIASALFHLFVIVALWVGLPRIVRPPPKPVVLIPIEIAQIAPMSAIKKEEKPQPPEPPKPDVKPEPPKPEPPKPETPQPTPPKPPEPVPAPPKPPEPQPTPKPQPKPKPPEPKKEPPKQDSFTSVLKNVAKLKKDEPPKKPDQPQKNQVPATPAPQAPAIADRLTVSEEDLLRQQMRQCWNVPIGARDIENTSVEIYISVGPDRVLKEAIPVDQARMNRDPFFRAVAESALRALHNPLCSPLALPPEKYDQWKEMIFNFNPRDMF
jgi:outer membrane biosynthesis protein TonB